MRAYFSRRYRLSASHRLHSDALTEAENRDVYGKCNNPHGHGHNYIIEVTVAGQVDPVTGMVCNMTDLDDCVLREVIDRFDHTNLNLYPGFQHPRNGNSHSRIEPLVPTTENFCIAVYEILYQAFKKAELIRVRVEETMNNFFEYSGESQSILKRL